MQTSEALVVGYNPVHTAGRMARAQTRLRRSLVTVGFIVVLNIVLWFVYGQDQGARVFLLGAIPSAIIVIGLIVWRLIVLRSAREALADVGSGEAFRIDHGGITVIQGDKRQPISWDTIREVKAEGSSTGSGPNFVVEHSQGRYAVPLSFLDALPGTIDGAMRAYSGGRRGLDLSQLDSIW